MKNLNNRSMFIMILSLVGIGAILFFAPSFLGQVNRESTMDMTETNAPLQVSTPRIDTVAPVHTETATFAMG